MSLYNHVAISPPWAKAGRFEYVTAPPTRLPRAALRRSAGV